MGVEDSEEFLWAEEFLTRRAGEELGEEFGEEGDEKGDEHKFLLKIPFLKKHKTIKTKN